MGVAGRSQKRILHKEVGTQVMDQQHFLFLTFHSWHTIFNPTHRISVNFGDQLFLIFPLTFSPHVLRRWVFFFRAIFFGAPSQDPRCQGTRAAPPWHYVLLWVFSAPQGASPAPTGWIQKSDL